jgi:phosphatidylserine/phosphatidylglycerophosphate/cardiolipin synthase-like enzyme
MATRFTLTICIAGLILPITTWAQSGTQVEIHYAPRENLESVDVQEIGRAELSIDMAAYVLSDPQNHRGADRRRRTRRSHPPLSRQVSIRRARTHSRGGSSEALLAHPNVSARVKGEGVLMHLKAYAVDGEVLRTGSGNFSRSGLSSQDNDLILIADQAVVDAFEANFDRIWARAQNIGALDALAEDWRARWESI